MSERYPRIEVVTDLTIWLDGNHCIKIRRRGADQFTLELVGDGEIPLERHNMHRLCKTLERMADGTIAVRHQGAFQSDDSDSDIDIHLNHPTQIASDSYKDIGPHG